MGALHAGHLSLVERCIGENDLTLVSSFVNPTQFDDPHDLERYPRTYQADLELLQQAGADFLLLPEAGEIYRDQYHYQVVENELSRQLCGPHRPGHFEGVLTVVLKLLNIARADRAYFGEKDYQQYLLIRGMCQTFFQPTQIIACPTVREPDGLALSSRNRLLSDSDRQRAADFPRLLAEPGPAAVIADRLRAAGFDVDYVEERYGRRFGAVRIAGVRLIDNIPLAEASQDEIEVV